MSKFQSPGKAAAALGVHPATIRRWVDEGRLPGAVHTAGGHVRIPPEDIERLRGNSGCGKALLYLRVRDESERKYLAAGLAHLMMYAMRQGYSVTRVVSEVGPGVDGDRPKLAEIRQEIQHGEPGYEAIIVERPDRLLLTGGDEFIRWAAPAIRVEVAGASCPEADTAYRRELLVDLFYPLADALALRGVTPARIENIVSKGLEGMAEALGLLGHSICYTYLPSLAHEQTRA
jgi:excisionase family DNA binding protein